jgi:hypothetical protein
MKIKALVSAAGEHMIRRGAIYTDLPDEVCKEYIRCGFAELIPDERKVADHGNTASVKHGKRK